MKKITLPGFKVGEAVILDDGEFVARWEDCPACGNYNDADRFGCECCNGTGRAAVPVETQPDEAVKTWNEMVKR